jgi:hypothetical protein
MIRIIARCRKGIEKHACGFIKRDTVFPHIRGSLSSIPFEAHLDVSPPFSIAAEA